MTLRRPYPRSTTFYSTSVYGGLSRADAAAAAVGGTLVIDSAITLTANTTLTSTSVIFLVGGIITLGSFNLVLPADVTASEFAKIFVQTSGSGKVTFAAQTLVYTNWWGSDPTGNNGSSAKLATYNAFQFAELAVDGVPRSTVSHAPGYYILNAAKATFFRNSHHIATPGTVRLDYDPSTITNSGYPNNALFQLGNPNTRAPNGQKNGSFIANTANSGSSPFCVNCNFVGAYDPATVSEGLIWSGIDIVHDPTPQSGSFLGTGKFCQGVYANASFDMLIKDSWFVGMANDGFLLWGGSATFENCHFWLNGFYGGAANNDSSRNGSTCAGWMDLLTPSLNSQRVRYVNCTAYANANTGLAPGGSSNDTLVDGCTTVGNATEAYELILFQGEDITEWFRSAVVTLNDLMYVPGAGSVAGSPPNLGGFVFQCTTGGTTSSGGSGPTGTVGQTGITDGTVTWQCIGKMPANGRIPGNYGIANTVDEGAIPTSFEVPYIGIVSTPTKVVGNGVNGQVHFVLNGSNEKRMSITNVVARNFGYSGSTSAVATINSNNGGTVVIDQYEQDNCYYATSGPLTLNLGAQSYWGSANQGVAANNKARVRISNIRFRSPTVTSTSSGLITVLGNLSSYDIEGVDADTSAAYYIVYIDHSHTASSVLEYGRLANFRTYGCQVQAVRLVWTNTGSVVGGIDLEELHCYNCASSGTLGVPLSGGFLELDGPTALIPMSLRLQGCKASYAGGVNFPLHTTGISNNSIELFARGNRLTEPADGQGWYILGSVSHPLTGGQSVYANVDADDNGLPGEKLGRSTAAPTTGTWNQGDKSWRYSPGASGTVCDICTTSGSLTGQMSSCAVTISNTFQTGTYTGTPPLPGEYINFNSGPTGTYQVVYAFGGNIAFLTAANNNASGVTVTYSAGAVFTGLTLP